MFLGMREVLYAKGRFALMTAVIGLITVLLVMLTDLTHGLGQQNTSVLTSMGADRFVFGAPVSEAPANPAGATATTGKAEVSFANAAVTEDQVARWRDAGAVATPVGFAQTKVEASTSDGAAILGVPSDAKFMTSVVGDPQRGRVDTLHAQDIALSESLAKKINAHVNENVIVQGETLTVVGIVADEYYSHSLVAWTNTSTWRDLVHQPESVVGSALVVTGGVSADAWSRLEKDTKMVSASTHGSFRGLPAYSTENGSLVTMQGFLYVISALVTVSFLTVWTMQRTRDIAVLRALGAARGYLMRDALGQAAVVLAAGVVGGGVVGWALGLLAGRTVPFETSWVTTAGPAVGMWGLGILGAVCAVRKVSTTNPLIALGGN